MIPKITFRLLHFVAFCTSVLGASWPRCELHDFRSQDVRGHVLRQAMWHLKWGIAPVFGETEIVFLFHQETAGYCNASISRCEIFEFDNSKNEILPLSMNVVETLGKVKGTPPNSVGAYRIGIAASDKRKSMTIPGSSVMIEDPLRPGSSENGQTKEQGKTNKPSIDFVGCRCSKPELESLWHTLLKDKPLRANTDWPRVVDVVTFIRGTNLLMAGGEIRIAGFEATDPVIFIVRLAPKAVKKVYALQRWHDKGFKLLPLQALDANIDENTILQAVLSNQIEVVK
jgi:hypothetical protein